MILIALGANLHSKTGSPQETCLAAIRTLVSYQIGIERVSRWYSSPAVPASDQPPYVNGVIVAKTALNSRDLLKTLLEVEKSFGRSRSVRNAPRTLDLDLLAYQDEVRREIPILPHPRLHERAFVLLPLQDVAPEWRHPISGRGIQAMLTALETAESVVPIM